ncbi:GPI-linked NAD(P)(+)--arginine ADP-ribosyltransferase 1-like [Onychostoma macrolepis]|uniref:GPI-linked NAD(P)(+)--arginine ADP-ribosyltransferase 1-like n=1 Tax=Onychostoma macrolepis TaxID=369639 RepID=UPI00272AEEC9|nr:GPI-linked NAD(P)(+)--arginine ADP-ribosyltransferase 1-like [Onychostoma macrolepis]
MVNLVKTKYLEKEMQSNFAIAWKHAEKNYKPPGDNLKKNHSIAIYVYNNTKFEIYKDFNNAVECIMKKYQNMKFKWYSLHFLLTDSVQILNKIQKGSALDMDLMACWRERPFTPIFLSKLVIDVATNPLHPTSTGKMLVFQPFWDASAARFKFDIIFYDKEEEVVIPPYEKFKVIAVRTRKGQKDLWCDTVYVLKSSGNRSDLNCALLNIEVMCCALNKMLKFK